MIEKIEREKILKAIAKKDFDREYFVELSHRDAEYRHLLIDEMITNKKIMIYYHCFLSIAEACKRYPEQYLERWDDFSELLDHENSYKRDFALSLIASLIRVDKQNHFDLLKKRYLDHIYDSKFMTAECCMKNIGEILRNRRDLIDELVAVLLNWKENSFYTDKQNALMDSLILEIFEQVYDDSTKRKAIDRFVVESSQSISPKTRKKSKLLRKKIGI